MASTAHQDFKGHHLKPRPYEPHNNEGRIKVARFAPLNTELLATSDEELLKTLVVEMGCPDSGMWYVDTAGCGMLQANPANPPPKNGFVHRVMRCAAVLFLTLMVLAWPTSCQKEPKPTPTPEPIPTDTITPINPNDTIVPTPNDTIVQGDTIIPNGGKVVYFYYEGGAELVPFDTLQRYQNDPAYDTIYLAIRLACGDAWTPDTYTALCQNLRPRFSRFSKLHGYWGIRPHEILPNEDSMNMQKMGIAELHRDYLVSKGYYVIPVIGKMIITNPQITMADGY